MKNKWLSFIFIFSFGFSQDWMEFIVSYRAKVKNNIFTGEEYKVSKVIDEKGIRGLKDGSFKVIKICRIIPQDLQDTQDLLGSAERVLKMERELVLDCLYSSGVSVTDEVVSRDLEARSRTIFEIPPRRVVVALDGGVVDLGILEEKK